MTTDENEVSAEEIQIEAIDLLEDRDFSEENVMALATLLHHYRYITYRKTKISETKLAKEFGVTQSELNNFLRQGAKGKGAANKIASYLYKEYVVSPNFDELPDHIKRACAAAFDSDDKMKLILRGDLNAVFRDCASKHEEDWEAIDNLYAGSYDIYRYAAHLFSEEKPREIRDEEDNISYEANAIRAALQIYKREEGQRFPRFKLHYKTAPRGSEVPANTSQGSIIVISNYLFFIGRENRRRSPIQIVCHFDPQNAVNFNGLVLRQHDGAGQFFAAKTYFSRNNDVESIDEIEAELGVLRETELPVEIQNIKNRFINTTEYGGKSCLLLTLN